MKKYKFYILAIIALILAFSCFTGFVSVPTVRAEYVDGMFPPFTADNFYLIFDFTESNIELSNVGLVSLVDLEGGVALPLSYFSNVGFVYCITLSKSVATGTFRCSLDFSNLVDLDYIGFPSFSSIEYYDINNNKITLFTSLTPNIVDIMLESPICYCVISIDNPLNTSREELDNLYTQYSTLQTDYNTLRTQNDNLEIAFRNQQLQLISETSRANQAEANYNNLLTQYNDLNSTYEDLQLDYNSLSLDYYNLRNQYTTLQGEYEDLETQNILLQSDFQDALELADSYQRELREVTAQNERLQELVNNLPPTDLAFGWVGTAFATLDSILSIEIIPNISIGSLVLIPLILGVLFFVLRLIRGE